ncbi:MAG: hypothetical protein II813_00490 [Spirochaetales bacterium]|nr:hypothetical protein [Spirochaetales bacterium]
MSKENSMQMTLMMIGIEEGERRGRMRALRDAAYTMSEQGVDFETVAKYLGLTVMNLRYLVNCTEWDICSTMCSACRINEPVYKETK